MRRLVLSIVLGCVAAGSVDAGIVIHRRLQAEDGIVQSQVNAVLEASDGMLWLGTFGGVTRWDGTRCDNFELHDGLAGLDVRAFCETPDGGILIATADNGISLFRDGAFTSVGPEQGLPSDSTRGFHIDERGRVLVATADGLAVFADASLDTATLRHELPGTRVSGFSPRRVGGCYMSTFSHGVLVWDGERAEPLLPAEELPGRIIRAVHERADGSVLVSVYHAGVWVWRDGALTRWEHDAVLDGHDVMAFDSAPDGTLYLSTLGGGVLEAGPDGVARLDTAAGLSSDTSWDVHVGPSGTVYIGTWDGVAMYDPGRTMTLNGESGLAAEIVLASAELPDGRMAVSMMGAGVALCRDGEVVDVLDTTDGLEHDRVWSLLTASDGALYFGTNAGVDRLVDGRLETVYRESEEPSGRIYAMHEAPDGVIWLATYGGIHSLREGAPELLYDEQDGPRSSVYAVAGTRSGDLLFGTGRGLITVRDGRAILPPDDSPLADLHVWSVLQASDGTLMLGTNGRGLWTTDSDRPYEAEWTVLMPEDGLSGSTIYGLVEDGDGRVFAATRSGVTILDRAHPERPLRRMHAADGLAGEECTQGRPFVDSRGRVWLNTIRGVTRYDPARDHGSDRPPRIHWRRVRLFDVDLPLSDFTEAPEFGHDENFLRFEFVATDPAAPHRVRTRHRLSGVDRDWVEEGRTAVDYSSLFPGSYEFSVSARNDWSGWSEPVTLAFSIRPPFWRTWWFMTLVVLGVAGIAAAVVWLRARQLLAIESLRTRIAADLHDDIGAGLTEVGILANVMEMKLGDGGRDAVGTELDGIRTRGRELVQSMSDIVWLVHPHRDSLRDLLQRLVDGFGGVCEASGIDFRVEGLESVDDLSLGLERRQHLYLIFKEAVNNAVKYAGCSTLRVEVRAAGRRVEMRVQDDGQGFDSASASAGNGLRNMRRRAEKLGGGLEIDSTPGAGTTITYRDR